MTEPKSIYLLSKKQKHSSNRMTEGLCFDSSAAYFPINLESLNVTKDWGGRKPSLLNYVAKLMSPMPHEDLDVHEAGEVSRKLLAEIHSQNTIDLGTKALLA